MLGSMVMKIETGSIMEAKWGLRKKGRRSESRPGAQMHGRRPSPAWPAQKCPIRSEGLESEEGPRPLML